MSEFDKKLGERLKTYRKRVKLNQTEAAAKIGKSRSWLTDIECGKNQIFFKDFIALSKVYGMSPEEINEAFE